MTSYTPPIDDIRFVLDHVVRIEDLLGADRFDGIDADMVSTVVGEVGRFLAEVVAPTNRDGDQVGSVRTDDGGVVTPRASRRPTTSGWPLVSAPCPSTPSTGAAASRGCRPSSVQEMLTSANMAFSLCSLLTQGAIDALQHHGSAEQQATYLPKMLTGEWTGTMNLTEPQAGSDVGALTTRAEPVGDGSWTGSPARRSTSPSATTTWPRTSSTWSWPAPPTPLPGPRASRCSWCPSSSSNDDGSLG